MRARVYITLKPDVHDPAGQAVRKGLVDLGYDEVRDVRIGRFVELDLDASPAGDARARVADMCARLLANGVVEDVRVELE